MARGVMATGESQTAAENQVRRDAPHIRVLRSRQIDLSGLPALGGKPLPKHWVVVVEDPDPDREAKLPQHDDPEEEVERELRLLYLSMATDPDLVVSGVIEDFPCPVCEEAIRLQLPPPRENKPRTGAACPNCRAPLVHTDPTGPWAPAPTPEGPDRTCIFCTAKADSYEHAIPAWSSKRLGIKSYLTPSPNLSSPERKQAGREISFASYRKRIFCSSCNWHFKSLEDEVIPLLVSMAHGRPLSLGRDTQQLLALWAHKTAIALLAADGCSRDDFPYEHRRSVRQRELPGDGCRIDFFAWSGGPTMGIAAGELVRPGEAQGPDGYLAFLTFAQVGFRVIGFEPPLDVLRGAWSGSSGLVRFWPNLAGVTSWPPPQLDDRFLPKLFEW